MSDEAEPLEPEQLDEADVELEIMPVALARLELRPGDKIVVMAEETLSRGRWAILKERIAEFFPGCPVLLLDGGTTLGIVSQTEVKP